MSTKPKFERRRETLIGRNSSCSICSARPVHAPRTVAPREWRSPMPANLRASGSELRCQSITRKSTRQSAPLTSRCGSRSYSAPSTSSFKRTDSLAP